jgi:hypothetical protein
VSRKGIPNKITDEQRAWAARVDKMLSKASPDGKEGFDRLICRLLTTGQEQTKIALIRLMIPYRRGLPKQDVDVTFNIMETLADRVAKARKRAGKPA